MPLTATELLAVINPGGEPGFPKAANALSERVNELKPNLAAVGVDVDSERQGRASRKMICIAKRNIAAAS
ncbi:MAG TPA: hypothetical protein VLV86_01820 [Vicinamibacterales bacterium]|nr:hypothetical protein [Vicinamibacterales bacterium]